MFWPQFSLPAAAAASLILAATPRALAQTPSAPNPPSTVVISGSLGFGPKTTAAAAQARTDAMLAALSAEAGIPYQPSARSGTLPPASDKTEQAEARLCVRAGLGLSVPTYSGPQLTVEHGLFGCPTDTGGLPIVVIQDPALQPPPATRAGEYNVDLTVRYRLLRLKHMQVLAVAAEQGVGYSLSSPVSGNNLLVGMSLVF